MNNKFILISFFILICSGFVIGIIFPNLPVYFYIIYGLTGGGVLLIVNKRRIKKNELIVSDERYIKNMEKASLLTYRITYAGTLITGMMLQAFSQENSDLKKIGLTLIFVSVIQTMIFTISYVVYNRKS